VAGEELVPKLMLVFGVNSNMAGDANLKPATGGAITTLN